MNKDGLTKDEIEYLEIMTQALPPTIARKSVEKQLGGIVSTKTLHNADAHGDGPAVAWAIGRNVVYKTETLLEWLIRRFGVVRLQGRH